MSAQRVRERAALLRLHDQKIGIAELVMLIPERHLLAHGCAEMKDRNDRHTRDGKRHDRGRMVMTDGHDIGARLIDATVNHALGVEMHLRWLHWSRVERVF